MQVVATQISSVTVYRNGALVVRSGAGAGDVEVRGLPLLFASDTLRVRPESGSVVGLEETMRLSSAPAPIPADEEGRARVLLAIARVDDEIQTLSLIIEAMESLAPTLPNAEVPVEKLVDAGVFVDLVAFAGARARDVVARRRSLELKRRDLDNDLRRLDERAGVVPSEVPRVMRGASFTLDVQTRFDVEYFVHAARWVPSYALHLAGGTGRLVTAALVAQATGEDWTGAALGVCTADLSRETTLPTLSSWRIGRAQQKPTRAFRPLPTDLPSLFYGYDKAPRRPVPKGGAALPSAPEPMSTAKGFDARVDTDELRSFEKMPTGAAMPRYEPAPDSEHAPRGAAEQLAELDDDDGVGSREGGGSRAFDAPVTKTSVSFAPPPPPAPSMMRAAPMAQSMPSAGAPLSRPSGRVGGRGGAPNGPGGGGFGGSAGGSRDEGGTVQGEGQQLPQRFRTAYMRMAGPDESKRGALLPLDPLTRMMWLLEAHDVDNAGKAELQRAVQALQLAQARLDHQPLPRGTQALLGTHFPSVMQASAPTDVPGDGTFYRVEVRVDQGAATTEHKAVPRESNDVWRTCRLDVTGPPLPAGPLAVYEDGAFKVNAQLEGSGGGKALDVNLGVDPDVRVMSRTVHVNQSEKGIMTSTSRVEHKIKMEVRSTRSAPATVVLYDRLPVPSDSVKDVTVNVIEEKPPIKRTNKDAFNNDVQGAFEWRVVVMPGDTHAIDFTYAIDLPAKTELEGGNRRE